MAQGGNFQKVQSLKNQALIADKCLVAERFFERLQGLIGRTGFEPGEGMFFPRCNDIHMWFMSIPLDVVFIRVERSENGNCSWKVSTVHENVRPWKLLPIRDSKATATLELPAGTVGRCDVKPGDEICLS